MSNHPPDCPRALATVAYLYGEHDSDAHAVHIAGCAACSAIVADHEAVAGALTAGFGRAEAPAAVVVALPRRGRARLATAVGSLVALAAGALVVARLLAAGPADPAPPEGPALADAGVGADIHADAVADAVADAELDVALDDLDLALASLELEL